MEQLLKILENNARLPVEDIATMLKPPTKAHSALNSVTDSARDTTTSTVFFLFRPRLAKAI